MGIVVMLLVTTAVLTFLPATVVAQSRAQSPGPWLAKTRDGQPDLQGIWRITPGLTVYSYDIQDPAPDVAYPGRGEAFKKTFKPLIVDPADGKIPYQPWAREKRQQLYQAAFAPKHLQEMDPQAFCVPGGPPRMAYQFPFQIFQYPGHVVMVSEFAHVYRVIPLDGRPHLPNEIMLFMGDSRGRWEGNTLVVEVKNNNGRNWLDVAGDFHSDQYTVVERWTRVTSDSLVYEVTIQDPIVYTRPWKMRIDLIPQESDYEFIEHACHEGNINFDFTRLGRDGKTGAK